MTKRKARQNRKLAQPTQPERVWTPASLLPSPGIRLLVELETGEIVEAIRPDHILSYGEDPNYRQYPTGNRLQGVKQWAIY